MKRHFEKIILSLLVGGMIAGGAGVAAHAVKAQNETLADNAQTVSENNRDAACTESTVSFSEYGQVDSAAAETAALVDSLNRGDKDAVADCYM